MSQDESELRQVVAENIRRIRTERGWSQERLAVSASLAGASWSRVTVTEIEAGRRPVSLEEFFLLPAMFGGDMDIKEFVRSEGEFWVGDFRAEPGDIEYFLRGGEDIHGGESPWTTSVGDEDLGSTVDATEIARRETERNAARSLGVPSFDVALAALNLWSHGLLEERERRFEATPGEGSAAKRKGHITRELLRELDQKLSKQKGRKR